MIFAFQEASTFYPILGLVILLGLFALIQFLSDRFFVGNIFFGIVLPLIALGYFIFLAIGVQSGTYYAMNSDTYLYHNGWYHYAFFGIAFLGTLLSLLLKNKSTAIQRLALVALIVLFGICDIDSLMRSLTSTVQTASAYYLSADGVWIYGGWWNLLHLIAGIFLLIILVLTRKTELSKAFAGFYSFWFFTGAYLLFPTESWYFGLVSVLVPLLFFLFRKKTDFAASHLQTLTLFSGILQIFPVFFTAGTWSLRSSIYDGTLSLWENGLTDATITPSSVAPLWQIVFAVICCILGFVVLNLTILQLVKAVKTAPQEKKEAER